MTKDLLNRNTTPLFSIIPEFNNINKMSAIVRHFQVPLQIYNCGCMLSSLGFKDLIKVMKDLIKMHCRYTYLEDQNGNHITPFRKSGQLEEKAVSSRRKDDQNGIQQHPLLVNK